jgi:hypothetical protein
MHAWYISTQIYIYEMLLSELAALLADASLSLCILNY